MNSLWTDLICFEVAHGVHLHFLLLPSCGFLMQIVQTSFHLCTSTSRPTSRSSSYSRHTGPIWRVVIVLKHKCTHRFIFEEYSTCYLVSLRVLKPLISCHDVPKAYLLLTFPMQPLVFCLFLPVKCSECSFIASFGLLLDHWCFTNILPMRDFSAALLLYVHLPSWCHIGPCYQVIIMPPSFFLLDYIWCLTLMATRFPWGHHTFEFSKKYKMSPFSLTGPTRRGCKRLSLLWVWSPASFGRGVLSLSVKRGWLPSGFGLPCWSQKVLIHHGRTSTSTASLGVGAYPSAYPPTTS